MTNAAPPFVPSPPFGDMLEFKMPTDCDLVILCVDTNMGHEPVGVYLPHQIYRDMLQRLCLQHRTRKFTLIPVRTNEKIHFTLE